MAAASPPVLGTLNFRLDDPTFGKGHTLRSQHWKHIERLEVHLNLLKHDLGPIKDESWTQEELQKGCQISWPMKEDVSIPWGLLIKMYKTPQGEQGCEPCTGIMTLRGPTPKSPEKTYIFSVIKDGPVWYKLIAAPQCAAKKGEKQ